MEGTPGAPRHAPGVEGDPGPVPLEGSDINPSVDEQLLDQGPECSCTKGYTQSFG